MDSKTCLRSSQVDEAGQARASGRRGKAPRLHFTRLGRARQGICATVWAFRNSLFAVVIILIILIERT